MEARKTPKELRKEAADLIDISLGAKVRQCRNMIRRDTLERMSETVGFESPTYLARIERGETTCSLSNIWLFSQYFDIEPGFFLNPNLHFGHWFDEDVRRNMGIRKFSESPLPFKPYDLPC